MREEGVSKMLRETFVGGAGVERSIRQYIGAYIVLFS